MSFSGLGRKEVVASQAPLGDHQSLAMEPTLLSDSDSHAENLASLRTDWE